MPNNIKAFNTTNRQWLFLASAVIFIALFITLFTKIFIYLIVAIVLSLLGRPLVNLLNKKLHIPLIGCCAITIISLIALVCLFILFIAPLILTQVDAISSIDFNSLSNELKIALEPIQEKLWKYGFMDEHKTLESLTIDSIKDLIVSVHFQNIFSNIINVVSSLFIGVFAICFITFFFLRDKHLFHNIFMMFIPVDYEKKAENILENSHKMLVRYVGGLMIDLSCFMIIISSCLYFCGVPNALLLGFIGGCLNIIPYLGPVIGAILASVLAYITTISSGYSPDAIWIIVKVVFCFIGCNLLDAFLIQPTIYSKSVKAHPLEIFLVILISGQLMGVLGMIVAIPLYTIIRIIAKEFFNQSKFVNILTKQL